MIHIDTPKIPTPYKSGGLFTGILILAALGGAGLFAYNLYLEHKLNKKD